MKHKARGHRELVTVIGHAAVISAGEWVTASGEWINDRTHGQQFRATFLKASPPTTLDGIERYLASGMIRGIGPVYAKKLLRAFGEKVFDVIEAEPGRLREVNGTLDQLLHFNVGIGINAPPMTFEVGGKQYVAIQSGLNRNALNINSMTPELREMRNQTMLYVFGL